MIYTLHRNFHKHFFKCLKSWIRYQKKRPLWGVTNDTYWAAGRQTRRPCYEPRPPSPLGQAGATLTFTRAYTPQWGAVAVSGSYWSLRERQMFETIFTTFVAKRKPCGNERVLYWTQATFPSKSSTIQSPAELHAPGGSPSPGGPARGGKSPRPAHGSPSPQPSQLPRPPVAAPASLSGLWTAGSVEPRGGGPGP